MPSLFSFGELPFVLGRCPFYFFGRKKRACYFRNREDNVIIDDNISWLCVFNIPSYQNKLWQYHASLPFHFFGGFAGVCSSLKMLTNSLAPLPPRGASNLSPFESGLALLTYLADKI